MRPSVGEIAAQGVGRLASDRDDPLLRPLAEAADEALLEIHRRPIEADGLADAEARAVEQLDERAVAQRAGSRAGRGLDQPLGLAGGKRARQRPGAPREI